jgi:hypothetical protein
VRNVEFIGARLARRSKRIREWRGEKSPEDVQAKEAEEKRETEGFGMISVIIFILFFFVLCCV